MIGKIKTYFDIRKKINFLKLPREDIEEIQLNKLKNLVEHAYATVPYYHNLFKNSNLGPADIETLEDIKKIPITSKQDLVDLDKNQITSSIYNKKDLNRVKSSGTTGEPFTFYRDKNFTDIVRIDGTRSQIIHGLRISDRYLCIRHNVDINISRNPLNNLLLRRIQLSSFSKPKRIFDFYKKFKPNVLGGYISNIYTFALWLEENNIVLKHKPKFVLCSGETAHDFMRIKVSKIFQAKVLDVYGSYELGYIAAECNHGRGYHIFEDSVLPEISEIDGNNYLVGTNLDNYATPFIRYNTRDVCEPWPDQEDNCSCGFRTKKIKRIIGRENDYIKTPGGDLISAMSLLHYMRKSYPFVRKYRFVQEDIKSLRLEVMLEKEFDENILEEIVKNFKGTFQGLSLEIIEVDDIPKDRSGKLRIVRSTV